MVSIFDYLDYREWLNAVHGYKQSKNPLYSLRSFAKSMGLDPSLLAKVLSGKRHLSPMALQQIIQGLDLDSNQSDFLSHLVDLAKAKTEAQKQEAYEKALALLGTLSGSKEIKQYQFYSQWYYSAIRNLLQIFPFYGKDFRQLGLQLCPPISAHAAEESIQLLLQLEMIYQDETGRYMLSNLGLTTGDKWSSQAVRKHHKTNIELGKEAIERFDPSIRDISGVTMNLGHEDLEHVRQMIKEFRQELITYVQRNAKPEQIYHLNLQLFPMSNIEKKEENGS